MSSVKRRNHPNIKGLHIDNGQALVCKLKRSEIGAIVPAICGKRELFSIGRPRWLEISISLIIYLDLARYCNIWV